MIWSNSLVAAACSIDHWISGLPAKSFLFFPGKPLLPFLAGINATVLTYFSLYLTIRSTTPPEVVTLNVARPKISVAVNVASVTVMGIHA